MVDTRLVIYIKNQLQKGYDLATIRKFLSENNYPTQEIDAAIQYLQSSATLQQGTAQQWQQQQQTAQQQLVHYVKQYLKQGYSAEQIRNYLLQYGYPSFAIQYALAEATKRRIAFPTLPKLALPSRKTIFVFFLILFVLTVIAATAWFFLNIKLEEAVQEITLAISLDKNTVAPGETIYITNDFTNMPSERDSETTIYYSILDSTGTQADSWELSFAAEDAVVKNTKYAILTSMEPGSYELHAEMKYGTLSTKAKTAFTVTVSEEELAAAEEEALEEEREEEEEEEEAEEIVVKQEVTTTGIPTANDYQNYATAKELAATDAGSAAAYCEKISSLSKKDECYSAIARESKDKSYCEQIVSDPTRDSCWVSFAFNQQDYSVCEEIANPFIKQSCEQLEKVSELKEQSS